MKYFFIVVALFIYQNSFSQNVGIGNNDPAEKLDVTGNINVTGTIKANGVDGMPNQVLMKNGTGNLQWGDMGDYKNLASFYESGIFTVPAGVTRIAVEIWGAGGGGTTGVGGGGGGYVWAQVNVVPGVTAGISVGGGGSGTFLSSASAGGASSVSINSLTITAYGGGGAIWQNASTFFSGLGGGFPVSVPGLNSYYGVAGTIGGFTKRSFQPYNSSTFYETSQAGNGGMAYKAPSAAGQGNYIMVINSTPIITNAIVGNAAGSVPGGGGAGGIVYTGSNGAGGNGGNGLVIVYY